MKASFSPSKKLCFSPGQIYRITEDIRYSLYPEINAGDVCLILSEKSFIVETLIGEKQYSWLVWDLKQAIGPL